MKPFDWNQEKNRWLRRKRGVSFEQVIFSIESGKLLDIIRHPNPKKYRGQNVLVIEIEGYVYMVPYAETDEVIFLKTIFPSRKYTRTYLGRERK